jgi:Kef-type K+ transport system membrane component KefB
VQVLLAIISILVVTQASGKLLRFVRQPAVIGEMIGGILIGPSVLGRFFPQLQTLLFPESILPFINKIAQLGIILYMFIVGLELDTQVLKEKARSIFAIAYGNMLFTFLLGMAVSIPLFREYAPREITFGSFSAFLGVAMSITAFPVLARILSDLKIQKTEIGSIALSCAATGDVAAWCLLALAVSIAKSQIMGALQTVLLAIGFIFLMIYVVRPILLKILSKPKENKNSLRTLATLLVIALVCSFLTDYIGIHTIFGSFLFGAILSTEKNVVQEMSHRFEDLVKALFLPAFFAFSGLRTQLFLIDSWDDWKICALITLLATLGKFGGTYVISRRVGFDKWSSSILGVLMNTRGLVELIVLNVGLDLGIISPRLFAMMVIMAIVTTLMTSPLTVWLLSKSSQKVSAFNSPGTGSTPKNIVV